MEFKDKVAVITGSAAGMGRSHAIAFAKEGAKVVLNDIRLDKLLRTADEIGKMGGNCLAIKVDVSSQSDVDNMFKQVVDKYGRVDILVNNAAAFRWGYIVDASEEDYDLMMDVNVKGVFLCSKAAAKHMINQGGGNIINISSDGGRKGSPLAGIYCASKFAVIGLTQSLAAELAEHKIRVNCVCPGTIYGTNLRVMPGGFEDCDKAWFRESDPEKLRKAWESQIPLGRVGWPEDVTKVVLFLASDKSDYITGQSINVDGGRIFS